jgi:two-component system cell cycle response regulator
MVKSTVLYIEDNPQNASLITKRLRRDNVLVLVAETGAKGLEDAHNHQPDLILMDFHLPDIDGVEVMRELKNDPATAHIPVAMLTADESAETRRFATEAGCDDYLLKPVAKQCLLNTIHRLTTQSNVSV